MKVIDALLVIASLLLFVTSACLIVMYPYHDMHILVVKAICVLSAMFCAMFTCSLFSQA